MLSCKDITERASEYRDRDMTGWQRMQFRMHPLMCQHCRRFMDQFNSVSDLAARQLHQQEQLETIQVSQQVAELMQLTKEKNRTK